MKRTIKFKPSILFLIATFICLFFGIITKGQVFDIQLHDTYYVFDNFYVLSKICLVTGILSMVFFFIERPK